MVFYLFRKTYSFKGSNIMVAALAGLLGPAITRLWDVQKRTVWCRCSSHHQQLSSSQYNLERACN